MNDYSSLSGLINLILSLLLLLAVFMPCFNVNFGYRWRNEVMSRTLNHAEHAFHEITNRDTIVTDEDHAHQIKEKYKISDRQVWLTHSTTKCYHTQLIFNTMLIIGCTPTLANSIDDNFKGVAMPLINTLESGHAIPCYLLSPIKTLIFCLLTRISALHLEVISV